MITYDDRQIDDPGSTSRPWVDGHCFAHLPKRVSPCPRGRLGWLKIFYERYGKNEDTLVLFIHGGVGGLYTYVTGKLHQRQRKYYGSAESQAPIYKAFIEKLVSGDRCSVLAYDRRGCGNSRVRPGDENVWYSMLDLCDDIICLLAPWLDVKAYPRYWDFCWRPCSNAFCHEIPSASQIACTS